MSLRWPNSIVTKDFAPPSTGSAPGIWKTSTAAAYRAANQWPVFVDGDPYFYDVSLLLTGDGTNGAQNNTFLDSSVNNATITRSGSTTQGTFSPYGDLWSNYFNGTADRLSAASNAAFGMGTGNFTFEFWLYYTGGAGYKFFFSTYPGTSGYIGYGLQSGTYTPWVWNDGNVLTASSNITLNTWQHHAVVRNGSTLTIYLNGVSIGSTTWSTDIGASRPMYIGWNGVNDTQSTNGYISNFRVVKGTALYTSTFTPSTAPLTAVSGTSLLTCQSNRFKDNSSNNFTLTVSGTPSVQRFSPFNPTAAYDAATIGGSGYFASGAYLSVPDSTALNLSGGSYTIEGWIYPDGNYSNYNTIVAKRILGGATTAWEVYLRVTSGVFSFYNGTNYESAVTPPAKAWSHFAAVYDGTNMNLYLNGTRVLQTAITNTNQSTPVYIGTFPTYGEQYLGYISNMRITKGAALYSGTTLTVPTAPLTTTVSSGTVSLLTNFTNAGIPDAAMMNDLETVGNAQVSTSVKKYGTGSLYFDGTGDSLLMPDSPNWDFGSGSFTIEMWINTGATAQYTTLLAREPVAYATGEWALQVNQSGSSTGNVALYVWDFNSGSNTPILTSSGVSVRDNSWHHIAVVRNGSSWALYIDGVSRSTNTWSGAIVDTAYGVSVGQSVNYGRYYTGYIDDLRVTKGYARYTSNFTPPTAAFPTY